MVVVLGNVQSVSMYGGVGGFDRLQSGFQGSCFERLHFQVSKEKDASWSQPRTRDTRRPLKLQRSA